jgi:hypothetical protein
MELIPNFDIDANPFLILKDKEKLVIFELVTKQFYQLYESEEGTLINKFHIYYNRGAYILTLKLR